MWCSKTVRLCRRSNETTCAAALRPPLNDWPEQLTDIPGNSPLVAFAKLLTDIQREWDKAEHCMKLGEHFSERPNNASINELRYAGRRLIDALNDRQAGEDNELISQKLTDALFNCVCAQHDAIDISLDIMAVDFGLMEKKLGYAAILGAYSKFPDLYTPFAKARSLQAESRGDRRNRDAIYDTVTQVDLPKLAEMYGDLKACKPIMLAFAARDRRQRFSWWVMWGLTVSSLTVAALSFRNGQAMRQIQEQAAQAPVSPSASNRSDTGRTPKAVREDP
jgi:hypothetical protein